MVRQAKADKKAAEELERRKMEKVAVQTALVDLDAEALKADEERQRVRCLAQPERSSRRVHMPPPLPHAPCHSRVLVSA